MKSPRGTKLQSEQFLEETKPPALIETHRQSKRGGENGIEEDNEAVPYSGNPIGGYYRFIGIANVSFLGKTTNET